jgi:hypothetical protein
MVMPLSSLRGAVRSASFVTKISRFRQIRIVVTVADENRAEVVSQGRDPFTS